MVRPRLSSRGNTRLSSRPSCPPRSRRSTAAAAVVALPLTRGYGYRRQYGSALRGCPGRCHGQRGQIKLQAALGNEAKSNTVERDGGDVEACRTATSCLPPTSGQ